MNSREITRRQAQAVKAQIEPMRDYLHRLRVRMANRGFPPDDPLYLLVTGAQQSIGALFMDVANRAYGGPIDPPQKKEPNPLDQRSARKRARQR
jgi:hypothetical protein